MALTVQQLLSDAKRLSSRLRDHDQSADHLISRTQEVLKEVDAMRQYQEDVDNLNEVAHNRPRAQLVLGIQQENRHIRTLQQENKELRAALEEHQSALELIMSKYRQHVTRLVNSPAGPDMNAVNNYKHQLLAERTEKVCEMAAVMKEAVRVDEETCNKQQEVVARLVTENKGLRELLEISQRGSSPSIRLKKVAPSEHKEVQTEQDRQETVLEVQVTLPRPGQSRPAPLKEEIMNPGGLHRGEDKDVIGEALSEEGQSVEGDSDETGSEDESVKYDTIKLADRRQLMREREERTKEIEDSVAVGERKDVDEWNKKVKDRLSVEEEKWTAEEKVAVMETAVKVEDKESDEVEKNSSAEDRKCMEEERKCLAKEVVPTDNEVEVSADSQIKKVKCKDSAIEQKDFATSDTEDKENRKNSVEIETEEQKEIMVNSLLQQLVTDTVDVSSGGTTEAVNTVRDTLVSVADKVATVAEKVATSTDHAVPVTEIIPPVLDVISPVQGKVDPASEKDFTVTDSVSETSSVSINPPPEASSVGTHAPQPPPKGGGKGAKVGGGGANVTSNNQGGQKKQPKPADRVNRNNKNRKSSGSKS